MSQTRYANCEQKSVTKDLASMSDAELRQLFCLTRNLTYQVYVQCMRGLYKEKGIGALYFGLVPKLLQTVSHAALMFAFYEKIHWAIRRLSRRGASQLRRMKRLM
ncbi:hypothetical protein AK812_SmicGene17679 [Symbiodinium microadriaticum]|uniref:Uncharacterized protein n=1 Tax=Symbiodinium microadriaticum TaxID=2951 RepID=A0A1Q9DX52_SYMMI|nr:hypothetical protein AK812_SmicGene17679 [Symbiodinium microadriaticum]